MKVKCKVKEINNPNQQKKKAFSKSICKELFKILNKFKNRMIKKIE
jgi:hypothetical protein